MNASLAALIKWQFWGQIAAIEALTVVGRKLNRQHRTRRTSCPMGLVLSFVAVRRR